MSRAAVSFALALAASVALAPLAQAQDAEAIATAAALRDRALEGSGAYEIVEEITTRFGPRPAGSPAEQAAAQWGAEWLRDNGFDNVRVDRFPLSMWDRGEERVEIVGDFAQPLTVTALGGAVATPHGGGEGEAAIFETFQDLLDAPAGSLTGKVAVVLQDTPRAQDGRGYGSTSVIRFQGPSEAAARGAAGFLLRSLGTHDHRFAHTGATRVGEGTIPAFAIPHRRARGAAGPAETVLDGPIPGAGAQPERDRRGARARGGRRGHRCRRAPGQLGFGDGRHR